jgi:Tfp pilus assembly protein FimT
MTRLSTSRLRPAFTLLEVCIAMGIGALLIGVAVMGISGVREEHQLRKTASAIETQVRESLVQAISTQRTVRIALGSGTPDAQPLQAEGFLRIRRYGEDRFREPKRGETWEFSPTGILEPVAVRVLAPGGSIELAFDPLTGCARERSIIVNG